MTIVCLFKLCVADVANTLCAIGVVCRRDRLIGKHRNPNRQVGQAFQCEYMFLSLFSPQTTSMFDQWLHVVFIRLSHKDRCYHVSRRINSDCETSHYTNTHPSSSRCVLYDWRTYHVSLIWFEHLTRPWTVATSLIHSSNLELEMAGGGDTINEIWWQCITCALSEHVWRQDISSLWVLSLVSLVVCCVFRKPLFGRSGCVSECRCRMYRYVIYIYIIIYVNALQINMWGYRHRPGAQHPT